MNMETRDELIDEFRHAAHESVIEWVRSWKNTNGDTMRARYMQDGTVEIERETPIGFDRVTIRFGIAVVDASGPNKPTGLDFTVEWGKIPAGWFVKTPGGDFWELLSTVRRDGVQHVKVRRPDGMIGKFQRDPSAPTQVRKGRDQHDLDDAVALLATSFGDLVILEDSNE